MNDIAIALTQVVFVLLVTTAYELPPTFKR